MRTGDPTCQHDDFNADCRVGRLTDEFGKPLRFVLEVRVACRHCKRPMLFKGKAGFRFSEPAVSATRMELRAPIVPAEFLSEAEIWVEDQLVQYEWVKGEPDMREETS